ncbi:hypothetical protein BDZ94DRAFT_1265273, partial [Collybia nuda]
MSYTPPMAHIRHYKPTDDKLVHFIVGKSNMESLAAANRQACAHPLTLSIWLALSAILTDFMHLWPTERHGLLGYLTPVPIMAATAVPIMFLIDWLNRPPFEQRVQAALKGPDLSNISEYYSQSPSSGLWILDYKEQFVGLIALDAFQGTPAMSKTTLGKRAQKSSGVASTATIRHFYVDEAYRDSGIQADLLDHAVRVAFGSDPSLQCIKASDSSLITYMRTCLRDTGFQLECITGRIGVYRWKVGQRTLERTDWERKNKL